MDANKAKQLVQEYYASQALAIEPVLKGIEEQARLGRCTYNVHLKEVTYLARAVVKDNLMKELQALGFNCQYCENRDVRREDSPYVMVRW